MDCELTTVVVTIHLQEVSCLCTTPKKSESLVTRVSFHFLWREGPTLASNYTKEN
jgi:hypothetical protein